MAAVVVLPSPMVVVVVVGRVPSMLPPLSLRPSRCQLIRAGRRCIRRRRPRKSHRLPPWSGPMSSLNGRRRKRPFRRRPERTSAGASRRSTMGAVTPPPARNHSSRPPRHHRPMASSASRGASCTAEKDTFTPSGRRLARSSQTDEDWCWCRDIPVVANRSWWIRSDPRWMRKRPCSSGPSSTSAVGCRPDRPSSSRPLTSTANSSFGGIRPSLPR
mmetsp:Transcript_31300/g.91669  ORF Transcript_31300/g.91669 Transcript_31300/m.91669 type:complete len:216 (-) Transcript_31300:671-1318(-)